MTAPRATFAAVLAVTMVSSALAAGCGSASASGPNGPDLSEPGDPDGARRPQPGQRAPSEEPPASDDAPPAEPARDEPRAQKKPGGLPGDAQALLDAHNQARATHCARPLVWSNALATTAQEWANSLRDNGCGFDHSKTAYGENLAAGTNLSAANAVALWYDEERLYNYKKAAFSMKTGHFTQVVWAGSRSLGCGSSECQGMRLWVCHYDPPGNVVSMFPANVNQPTCK